MQSRPLVWVLALLVGAAVLVSGCGSSSVGLGSPPLTGIQEITSGSPQNADGSHRWVAHFTAATTGTHEVQMLQGGIDWLLDPYVIVFEGDYGTYEVPPPSTVVASDDNSGPGNDALAGFYGYSGQVYTVWFTTYGPDDFGTFVYAIYDYSTVTTAVPDATDDDKTPVPPSAKLGSG